MFLLVPSAQTQRSQLILVKPGKIRHSRCLRAPLVCQLARKKLHHASENEGQAERHCLLGDSDRLTEEREVSQAGDLPIVEIRGANKIEDQRQRPQAPDRPGQPRPAGPQIEVARIRPAT
jgi:hypothetical protein